MMSVHQSPRTSPYVTELAAGLSDFCDVRWFNWRELFLDRLDVLHVHWPETFARGSNWRKAAIKALLFNAYLARPRHRRAAIVWTVHNLRPHERGSWFERATLRHFERNVDIRVYINRSSENNLAVRHRVALHPLLSVRVADEQEMDYDGGQQVRLLYFGLVRPYKKVDELIQAFLSLGPSNAHLRVVGEAPRQYAAQLDASVGTSSLVSLRLARVTDDQLGEEIAESDISLVPGSNLYNSGAALLALGMGRPVVLGRSPSTVALEREFGSEWVLLYDGAVDAEALGAAIESIRASRSSATYGVERSAHDPTRSWAQTIAEYVGAYQDAVALSRSRRRTS